MTGNVGCTAIHVLLGLVFSIRWSCGQLITSVCCWIGSLFKWLKPMSHLSKTNGKFIYISKSSACPLSRIWKETKGSEWGFSWCAWLQRAGVRRRDIALPEAIAAWLFNPVPSVLSRLQDDLTCRDRVWGCLTSTQTPSVTTSICQPLLSLLSSRVLPFSHPHSHPNKHPALNHSFFFLQ